MAWINWMQLIKHFFGFSASQNVNVSEVVDALLVNYDKRFRPNFNGEWEKWWQQVLDSVRPETHFQWPSQLFNWNISRQWVRFWVISFYFVSGAPVDVEVTLYVISLRDLSDIDMVDTLDDSESIDRIIRYFNSIRRRNSRWTSTSDNSGLTRVYRLESGLIWNNWRLGMSLESKFGSLTLFLWTRRSLWFIQSLQRTSSLKSITMAKYRGVFGNLTILLSIKLFIQWRDVCGTKIWNVLHFYYSRLTVTASCPMNFRSFPMDSQQCRLEMESCKFRLMGSWTY